MHRGITHRHIEQKAEEDVCTKVVQNSHGLSWQICVKFQWQTPALNTLKFQNGNSTQQLCCSILLTNLLPEPARAEALIWFTRLPMRLEYVVSAMFCTAPHMVRQYLPCSARAARQ